MTRSVEIPEAAVEAVAGHFYTMQSKIAWSQIDPNSSVALNYKRWAREALEAAALPNNSPGWPLGGSASEYPDKQQNAPHAPGKGA